MKKKVLFELPESASHIVEDPQLLIIGADLELSLVFFSNSSSERKEFKIRFLKERAFRKISELYCEPWHVEETYETCCEVINSDWVSELKKSCNGTWEDWVHRHFIIFIDGLGCLEVIAEDALCSFD